MPTLNIYVTGHKVTIDSGQRLSSGSNKWDKLKFTFDASWDGLTKYASLSGDKVNFTRTQLDSNNECTITDTQIPVEGILYIGAYGTGENEVIATTSLVRVNVAAGSALGTVPLTQAQYNSLIDQVSALSNDVENLRQTVNGMGSGNTTTVQNPYTLPVATSTKLGGVKPVSKTSEMTQEVGVDSAGRLYTKPGTTSGTGITSAQSNAIEENTAARHTHTNKSVLDQITASKIAQWNANSGGNVEELPQIYLCGDETALTTDKNKVDFRYEIVNLKEKKQKAGYCKLAWQGNSTMSYPKKNYTINLYKDYEYSNKDKADYLDLGKKESKWVMKANYNDPSMVRNIVAARIWGDIVHTRPNMPDYLSSAPNHGAVDGHPVEVYMNGEYKGLFMYNTPKEDWMLGLDDDNPLHCCVGADTETQAVRWQTGDNPSVVGWEVEVPKEWQIVADSSSSQIDVKQNFYSLIDFVSNSTNDEFVAGISSKLNLESAIDYIIFSQVLGNQDSMAKNQMLCTVDGGVSWWFTAYDMDQVFGVAWTTTSNYNTSVFTGRNNKLMNRIMELFPARILSKYSILRQEILSQEYILRELEIAFSEFPDGVKERNIEKWPSSLFQNVSDLETMKTYVINRLSWCDSWFSQNIVNPDVEYVTASTSGTTMIISKSYTSAAVSGNTMTLS